MTFLKRIRSRFGLELLKFVNKDAFEEDFLRILPGSLRSSAEFVFYRNFTSEEKRIAAFVETFRNDILAMGGEIGSYSSPHSGSFERGDDGRVLAGPYTSSSSKAHAMTGVNTTGGILLRRISTGLAAKRILELGTNTGFSGAYFLSCPCVQKLVTIEGSKDLCEIADRNLGKISDKYQLMSTLFDDAIDQLLHKHEKFDCVFIDGQHEREATWHYTKRVMSLLNTGGAIIFDDIYWSDDMNRFWKEICMSTDFPVTLDLRSKGVAISRLGDEGKIHHDICEYVGRPRVNRKGW